MAIDQFGCINNTIKVAAGHYFDLANPKPEDVDIESIATALSNICRFGGHCPVFYSVAQHCVHACELAWCDSQNQPTMLAILLHDAAEAYIGDMVKPLKVMMPEYVKTEKAVERAIADRFGLTSLPEAVKLYDRLMLKAEKMHFWPHDTEEWMGFAGIRHRGVPFEEMTPSRAKEKFLYWYDKITG